ncbi:response regulator receiver modulated metal dependent phosphohydrolase [Azonexus fungiphilus]|jgi:response regulator RpfG family c-di-GMP phosphodiesterase|uniref:Response regulator receiver modulated metal dependent phosphohydrolase n=1 Tax=Azonexus fungiphilus TaxID=146940 RepID=A0A495WAF2_9RHOO|nr:HD domain-containing phosphohydrolase [Azonexus fungiphilus]RKT58652.1 response regulator receiver modulated metal dependent phosphohydrolase [Azonexus fungiphilus]
MTDTGTAPSLLLVDDEPSILSALRRLFRPQGYRIFTAESGAAGLAILEQETIDLVISDMRMPEMDGATFLKAVRQRWPRAMRILLTGYADITSTVSAINEGEIYRYIAKPWDDTEMLTVVREACERQRLESENRRLTALTQAQNDELKTLNASLEQKVAERTAELRQALSFVEQAHGELKKSFMTSVQVFAGLIELRSGPAGKQLAGHGRRVAEHARAVARRLALSDGEAQNIMLAGLLHDIGKIGLPDDLLGKPWNTLSGEQRALVMKHPAIGQNILIGIERFRDAALIVRHHHECYDGSGYPDRLAGLAIPLGARILMVANDYDALQVGTLVQRPLKPAEALDFIAENSGKRYDPGVVEVFVKLIGETLKEGPVELPLRTMHLKPGMTVSRDLMHRDGYLLLAAGSVLKAEIISQLVRMEQVEQHNLTVHIRQEEK